MNSLCHENTQEASTRMVFTLKVGTSDRWRCEWIKKGGMGGDELRVIMHINKICVDYVHINMYTSTYMYIKID